MVEAMSEAGEGYAPGSYDTRRRSGEMAERWKSDVGAKDIDRVRQAYFACDPLYYRDEADWS